METYINAEMEEVELAIDECIAAYLESCKHWHEAEDNERRHLQRLIDDEFGPLEDLASKLRYLLCHDLQALGETEHGPDATAEVENEVEQLRSDHNKLNLDEEAAKQELECVQNAFRNLTREAKTVRDEFFALQENVKGLEKCLQSLAEETKNVQVAKKMNMLTLYLFMNCKSPGIYAEDASATQTVEWELHKGKDEIKRIVFQIDSHMTATNLVNICWQKTMAGLDVQVSQVMKQLGITAPPEAEALACAAPPAQNKSRSSIML